MAATNKRGVFSLETVLERQSDNHWSKIPEVFRYVNSVGQSGNEGPAMGYVLGGAFPYSFSTVDRVDYANDTATAAVKGPLSAGTSYQAAVSSLTHGYSLGGKTPGEGKSSKVDRLDYANDTATAAAKGPLSVGYYRSYAGVGNKEYGYVIGGNYPSGPTSTYVQRIEYASDTSTATTKGPMAGAVYLNAGTGNLSYGYSAGGSSPAGASDYSQVERLDYASDTSTMVVKGPLAQGARKLTATGSASYGYVGGGTSPTISMIQRIDYASDTSTAVAKGPLTSTRNSFASFSAPGHGYFTSGTPSSTVERMDYANDTATATAKGPLSLARGYDSGVSSRDIGGALGTPSSMPTPATRTETIPAGGPAYAFFAGGGPAAPSAMALSSVERIDFSNDTAAPTAAGNLADKQHFNVAVGNQSYGYNCGGKGGPSVGAYPGTRVQRIDYGNDSATAVFKGDLTVRRQSAAATGSNSYGYIIGGFNQDIPGAISTVDRIDYADDTSTALTRGTLPVARQNTMSTGNQSYGYSAGGEPAPAPAYKSSLVDRIDYASDTSTAAPKGNMHRWGAKGAATGNANYGWFSLGDSPSQSTYVTRIDYGNDTATSSPKGPLNVAKKRMGATGNGDYGYWSSGAPQPINTKVSRVDYSNDTATAVDKGPMTAGRYALGGLSSQAYGLPSPSSQTVDKGADGYLVTGSPSPYAYFGGGYIWPTGSVSTIRRMDYSNDSAVVAKSTLFQPAQEVAGVASQSHGYWAGGGPSGYSPTTFIRRLDFANDTTEAPQRGNLETGTYMAAGVGTKDYGYIAGGIEPSAISLVQRITYASDTATAAPKGNMTIIRALWGGATGNTSYAYFTGGWSPGASPARQSSVDRLDYSNDTATASPKGPLTAGKYGVGSTGNASYGYVGGGNPGPLSHVDRIDYGNDTATALAKGPLAAAMRYMSVTGNASYGYWLEGHPGPISTICRIDYSNDTASPSPGDGPNQYYGAGLSAAANALPPSSSFIPRIRWVDSVAEAPANGTNPLGYLGGGRNSSGTPVSTVDKIDYSNDTATASVAGSLTDGKRGVGAAGNNFFAYFAGGQNPSTGRVSNIDRLDYSSDSTDTLSKGNLTFAQNGVDGVGNASFGYFASSDYPILSTVNRVDYSNDTATAVVKGPLSNPVDNGGAAGNQSFGYFAGGGSPVRSTIDRIDYSNDTPTASPKGPLQAVKRSFAATGNASFGYWGGGYSGPSQTTTIDRLDYSSDTSTSLKGPLSIQRVHHSAVGNASFGYFAGGEVPSVTTTIDRLDYSSDTSTATPKGNISVGRVQFKGASAQEENGLTATAAIAAPVQPPFPYPEQLYNPATNKGYGYYGGGFTSPNPPASGRQSGIKRIDFTNDTATTPQKGPLSSARYTLAATGNVDYGYLGGGSIHPDTSVSTIDRLDYANDSTTTSPKGPLGVAEKKLAAVGNISYGYWCGGYPGGNSTLVQRLDFADDTTSTTPKGPLSANQQGWSAGAGNQSYGYIGGGDPTRSRVDRIDYSNDTPTATQKGSLTVSANRMAATGNASYGYWAGGSPGPFSTINRIDYSNDTPTASPKGNLSAARSLMGATGNTSYGYYGGGSPSSSQGTVIDRVDFSNDTATASTKGEFDTIVYGLAGVGAAENAIP